jgi:hypothetical protein
MLFCCTAAMCIVCLRNRGNTENSGNTIFVRNFFTFTQNILRVQAKHFELNICFILSNGVTPKGLKIIKITVLCLKGTLSYF